MEKTVAVKLTARVSQYLAAMAAASKATTGLATSASGLTKVGSSMQSVGANMTRYVSVPLVALGGAAVLMASRFETSFAQMVGLANVPASEVEHLRDAVLSLSGDTARSPQELADALYFAASSGLDAADAMDVVTLAAKAAAAGMGDTETVTGLITAAVASYGAANLTAAQAADILTSTIREGRAAPDELAQAMGRVLPIAASMGVSMNQVGGALAYLTNTGVDTDLAVTELRDLLVKLENPGKAAQAALEGMGTSADELRAAIAQDGLTGALDLLRTHGFDGNQQALAALMPDIRGLTGLTALLQDSAGNLDTIMGRLNNTTGSLGTAFDAVASTDAFKMKQALADIQVALIQIGAVLLPFAADAAKAISTLVGWFSDLPGPVQKLAVAFGGLAAAAGPVLFLAGSLIKNWQLLSQTLGGSAVGISSVAKSLGVLGLGVGAALYIFDAFGQSQRDAHARTEEVSTALGQATIDAWNYAAAATGATSAVDPLTVAQMALSNALTGNTDSGQALTQALGALGLQTQDAWTAISGLNIAANEGTPDAYAQFWVDLGTTMGLTGDKLNLFAGVMGNTMPLTASQLEAAAKAAGFADGEFARLKGGADGLIAASNLLGDSGLASLADTFINTTVATSDLGANLVKLARAQATAAGEGDNSIAVYEDLLALLPTLTDDQFQLVMGLGATAEAVTATGGAVAAVTPLWSSLWDQADKIPATISGLNDFKVTMLDVTEATAKLNAMAAASPAGENWVRYAEVMIDASRSGSESYLVYKQLMDLLAAGNPTWANLVRQQLGLGKALMSVIPGTKAVTTAWGDAAAGARDLAKAAEAPTQKLEELDHIADEAADRFNALQDAANMLRDAFDMVTTPADDLRAATRGVYQTFEDMAGALDENHAKLNAMGTDWDVATEDGRAMQEQTEQTRDAILEHAAAMLENGASAEAAAGDVAFNVKQLNDQWRAAGYTEDQIAALNRQYGLTPEQVDTALKTYGIEKANAIIDDYNKKIAGIPDTASTVVTPYMGSTTKVYGGLAALQAPRGVPVTPYLTTSTLYVTLRTTHTAERSAAGRYVSGPMLSTLGEAGDEVVLPLTNPGRMSALLGMSEVGPRVAAAMGGGSSGGGGSYVFNQYNTVTMAPGSDGDDVVRALRQYERRRGPLPVTVR